MTDSPGQFIFRQLRRINQQMSDEECIELLRSSKRGVLSMIGDGGYPYGVPMNHLYCPEDGHIYFHGSKAGHKIDSLRSCGKVSYTVIDEGRREEGKWWLCFRSVIVFGRIREVRDENAIQEICRSLGNKFTSDQAFIDDVIRRYSAAVLCLELIPEHICGKFVTER